MLRPNILNAPKNLCDQGICPNWMANCMDAAHKGLIA